MVIHSLYINKNLFWRMLERKIPTVEYVNVHDSMTNHSLYEQLDVVININNILLFQCFSASM